MEKEMTANMLFGLFTLRSKFHVTPVQCLAKGLLADPEVQEFEGINSSVSYRKIAQSRDGVDRLIAFYRKCLNLISSGVTDRERVITEEVTKELKELKSSALPLESIREFRRMINFELDDIEAFKTAFKYRADQLRLDQEG